MNFSISRNSKEFLEFWKRDTKLWLFHPEWKENKTCKNKIKTFIWHEIAMCHWYTWPFVHLACNNSLIRQSTVLRGSQQGVIRALQRPPASYNCPSAQQEFYSKRLQVTVLRVCSDVWLLLLLLCVILKESSLSFDRTFQKWQSSWLEITKWTSYLDVEWEQVSFSDKDQLPLGGTLKKRKQIDWSLSLQFANFQTEKLTLSWNWNWSNVIWKKTDDVWI